MNWKTRTVAGIHLSAALLMMGVAACSDSTSPDQSGGNVRIEGAMKTSAVPFGKVTSDAGAATDLSIQAASTVDSLRITSITMLLSEIKLQRKDSGGVDEKVKTGPALLTIDQNGARAVITGTMPAGTYNKVNLKFHRLNDLEVAPFAGNADFAAFVNADRHTIIVEGIAYDHGQAFLFTYGSKAEEDLKFDLADFGVTENGVTVIVIQIDPVTVFKDRDTKLVMDPRDSDNANRIDNAIKAALNALRK